MEGGVPFSFSLPYAWNALLLREIGSKFRSLESELCDVFNGSRAAAAAATAGVSMMHVSRQAGTLDSRRRHQAYLSTEKSCS